MNIKIVTASVRQGRIGPQISDWVFKSLQKKNYIAEVIDLKDWYLPLDDEPYLPASGEYIQDHTKQWSEKVESGDLFIFVFPQYNWGYPASLKNAVDHLYKEWENKVALMISYANRGGPKAADQFQQVVEGLHMRNLTQRIEINLKDVSLDENNRLSNTESDLEQYQNKLYELIKESEKLLEKK